MARTITYGAVRHPFFDVPRPIVIGHRGASGEAPENTLAAFERALADGAVDPRDRRARDARRRVVVCHDADVARTTNGAGAHRGAPLPGARGARRRLSTSARTMAPAIRSAGSGIHIPRFAEVFEALPETRFNIELKANDPRLIEAVVGARGGARPRAAHAAGGRGRDRPCAAVRTELARRGVARGGRRLGRATCSRFVRAAIGQGVAPPRADGAADPAQLRRRAARHPRAGRLRARHDVQVHVWTINEPDEMRALLALGVDGVMSDFPGRLRAVVDAQRGARALRPRPPPSSTQSGRAWRRVAGPCSTSPAAAAATRSPPPASAAPWSRSIAVAARLAELARTARAAALPIAAAARGPRGERHAPARQRGCGAVARLPLPAPAARSRDRCAAAPGRVLLYETFTRTAERDLGYGPKNPAFLLKPDELPALFPGLEIAARGRGPGAGAGARGPPWSRGSAAPASERLRPASSRASAQRACSASSASLARRVAAHGAEARRGRRCCPPRPARCAAARASRVRRSAVPRVARAPARLVEREQPGERRRAPRRARRERRAQTERSPAGRGASRAGSTGHTSWHTSQPKHPARLRPRAAARGSRPRSSIVVYERQRVASST